jgi:fructose-specific component phosphotransferase system IIB-like protein
VVKSNNGQHTAYFSTSSLEAADRNAGGMYCTAERDAPLGIVHLAASTAGSDRAIKMVGDKYLNYAHAQSACSQNGSVMSLANRQAKAFTQALNTAEAAQ